MLRKCSPCVRHGSVWGSDSIAPLIRNLNTRWRWAITLTTREKSQGIHRKWGWVSPRYDLDALHKKLLSCSSQEASLLTFSGNIRHHNFVTRYHHNFLYLKLQERHCTTPSSFWFVKVNVYLRPHFDFESPILKTQIKSCCVYWQTFSRKLCLLL